MDQLLIIMLQPNTSIMGINQSYTILKTALLLLTSPAHAQGKVIVIIMCVSLSVCYHSSGRYGYVTS